MPSLGGLMLLRRRVFRVFVVYLLNEAVNPTHVFFSFIISTSSSRIEFANLDEKEEKIVVKKKDIVYYERTLRSSIKTLL